MKILITAGTWDNNNGRPSGLAAKFADVIMQTEDSVCFYNGGNYENLQKILNDTPNFDIVFWFANVDNSLPKIRDVKSIAPHVMLVNSKRNDNNKYNFQELIQRSLAAKANLTFEFSKTGRIFNIRIFDPLGCEWYDGTDINAACKAAMDRLKYLKSITRQSTTQSSEDKNLVLKWYFDSFRQDMQKSDKQIMTPDETEFISLVRKYAQRFYEIMNPACDVKRFLGNCSTKPVPPQVGRCSKGMPSFRHDGDYIFVSQRNVDKEYLDISHFVPVYMEDNKIYYCGENKPSVDTPIQLRLYQALPKIKYMIHSHCYIENARFTNKSIPCGAIEEVDEVLNFIDNVYHDRNHDIYLINLLGHGSIAMADSVDKLHGLNYVGRPMPEKLV